MEVGNAKRGDLSGIYGYDIYHNRINHEIAYIIREEHDGRLVLIILAGTRERFYEQLKRYLKNTNRDND